MGGRSPRADRFAAIGTAAGDLERSPLGAPSGGRGAVGDELGPATFYGFGAAPRLTSATAFRGETPGDLIGPYLSQLLLKTEIAMDVLGEFANKAGEPRRCVNTGARSRSGAALAGEPIALGSDITLSPRGHRVALL
jgi:hypothetical protein